MRHAKCTKSPRKLKSCNQNPFGVGAESFTPECLFDLTVFPNHLGVCVGEHFIFLFAFIAAFGIAIEGNKYNWKKASSEAKI